MGGLIALLIPSEPKQFRNQPRDETERFVQSVLDALSDHVAVLDEQGQIVAVNAAWRKFACQNGYNSPNYGIGSNYLEVCDQSAVLSSREAPLIARAIRGIIHGQMDEFQMEYPCHTPLKRQWFTVRVSRFRWYHHTRVIVAHHDITDLKQAQIELAQSKRRLEAILDNVNNGILTIDGRGTILTANRAAARIFGTDIASLLHTNLSQLIDEPFEGKATFKRLNGDAGHELIGRRANGETFPLHLHLNELRLEDGSVYTCIIQDITYRKQAEQERIERERMAIALEKERELRALKNRFLSMMSHELRTPLTSIGLSYDILKKYGAVSTPEERAQALDNIRQQVDYLSEMISDVMTLTRFEADGFQINTEDCDLITYCRDIVEEFQLNYHKTHQIEFVCEEAQLIVPIDRKLLRRALTNLLTNAIKYSPNNSTVRFTLARDQDTAVITVSDQGIGIPPEDLPRLFEPFHRASNVDTIPGTGLGLPVTRQMVELHRGTIDCHSVLGQGTTFTIRLPI